MMIYWESGSLQIYEDTCCKNKENIEEIMNYTTIFCVHHSMVMQREALIGWQKTSLN
jgi:hypothetical protein